jgi:hypothetical protein
LIGDALWMPADRTGWLAWADSPWPARQVVANERHGDRSLRQSASPNRAGPRRIADVRRYCAVAHDRQSLSGRSCVHRFRRTRDFANSIRKGPRSGVPRGPKRHHW